MAAPILTFRRLPLRADRKTKAWAVSATSSGQSLGTVSWYTHWRRYVFYPDPRSLFDAECLEALATFCTDETHAQQLARQAEKAATISD